MPAIKRIFFFVLSNIAILVTIGILVTILQGVFHIQIGATLDSGVVSLLIYSAIYGFAGSLISLAISRMVVKWTMGIKLLNETRLLDYDEKMQTVFVVVSRIAKENGISMPEVGIYESLDPNAFATGPTKNRALVAVSTGLLTAMTKQEIEGVIGHEMSHVLNGDMVTMTLLQWVLNTFVIFFARVISWFIRQAISRSDEDGQISWFVGVIVTIVLEIALSLLASLVLMWFSRVREYAADRGSARMLGTDSMIRALRRLKLLSEKTQEFDDGKLAALKISSKKSWLSAFSSHPSIDKRITALEQTYSFIV